MKWKWVLVQVVLSHKRGQNKAYSRNLKEKTLYRCKCNIEPHKFDEGNRNGWELMQKKVPEVKSSFWWDLGEVFLCQIQKYNKESVIAPTTIEAAMSTMISILFVSILWCSPAGDPDFISNL